MPCCAKTDCARRSAIDPGKSRKARQGNRGFSLIPAWPAELAAAEDRNQKLYALGRELMGLYEKKSCGDILAEKEPFTGLRKVDTENLLEQYRDKLDEEKLIKAPGG